MSSRDQNLAEIETDKAVADLPSPLQESSNACIINRASALL
jgi:pyruvate/2-oxoglutarate dehydrogenase complex dihydrolipoamide acyltransferase (E2) component